MHLNHKRRWIFSPMVTVGGRQRPLAAEYSTQHEWPMAHKGYALVHCVMSAHQFRAAQADPHLIVLPSLHERTAVPQNVINHHSDLGLSAGMLLHEMLTKLAEYHPNFAPED